MTREDVIMMADASSFHTAVQEGELMRFAALVAKAERHRIIRMLQEQNKHKGRQNFYAYIIKLIEGSA